MKKYCITFISILLILLISACMKSYREMTAQEIAEQLIIKDVHPEGFEPLIIREVQDENNLIDLAQSSCTISMDFFGDSVYDLEIYVARPGKVNDLRSHLQDRFEIKVAELEEGYGGDVGQEITANSVIEVRGDYVVLFFSPKGRDALNAFEKIID